MLGNTFVNCEVNKFKGLLFVIISGRHHGRWWLIVKIDASALNVECPSFISTLNRAMRRCVEREKLDFAARKNRVFWIVLHRFFLWENWDLYIFILLVISTLLHISCRELQTIPQRRLCFSVNRNDEIVNYTCYRLQVPLSVWSTKANGQKCNVSAFSGYLLLFAVSYWYLWALRSVERHSSDVMLEDPIHIRMVSLPVHCLRLPLDWSLKCPKRNVIVQFSSFRTEEWDES